MGAGLPKPHPQTPPEPIHTTPPIGEAMGRWAMATARIPTYREAMAAGRDAGNRSMRAAGRMAWDESDFDAAQATFDKLMALVPAGEAA